MSCSTGHAWGAGPSQSGGNEHAAHHAGVNVRSTLLKLMITGSLLAALVGVLMTARISSGEANIGLQFPMQSIIAAVIGGIALNGPARAAYPVHSWAHCSSSC